MDFEELIRAAHPYLDCFDYDHYPLCFAAFEEKAEPILDALKMEPTMETADRLLNSLEQSRERLPRREKKQALCKDRQVLALFFTPAAGKRGEAETAFAELLRSCWNRRYPRTPYYSGTFEGIMKGFDANLLGLPLRKSRHRGSTD
ncbi:MAG: hypothetical protein K6C08_08720 [Oscillospiraceae bacterium]|nr:hypothetical protein [Oscillospiraceae bacterium]